MDANYQILRVSKQKLYYYSCDIVEKHVPSVTKVKEGQRYIFQVKQNSFKRSVSKIGHGLGTGKRIP